MPALIKPIEFLGTSLEDLRAFPGGARREAGFQLDRVQRGADPYDWKPMTAIGRGVREIRIREASGAYRVVYVARFEDAVHVIHCFQKKTQKILPGDIELAKSRYKEMAERVRRSGK